MISLLNEEHSGHTSECNLFLSLLVVVHQKSTFLYKELDVKISKPLYITLLYNIDKNGVLVMKKNVYKNIHYCGNGFKGRIVKANGITFCGFCGKEFRER